jgi:hypothetical protein
MVRRSFRARLATHVPALWHGPIYAITSEMALSGRVSIFVCCCCSGQPQTSRPIAAS